MADYRGISTIRGIRNNNPGNLDFDPKDKWLGMVGLEQPPVRGRARFIEFEDSKFGIRAAGRTIRNYERKYGIRTVSGIISRWAPPGDNNNTGAYIARVANDVQVHPDSDLDLANDDLLADLLDPIFKQENGSHPYSREELLEGIAMIGELR